MYIFVVVTIFSYLVVIHSFSPHLPSSPHSRGVWQTSATNFEKGGIRKKMSALEDLSSSGHGYLPGGAYYVSYQKRTLKKIYIYIYIYTY